MLKDTGKAYYPDEFAVYKNTFTMNPAMKRGATWPPKDVNLKASDIMWKPDWDGDYSKIKIK